MTEGKSSFSLTLLYDTIRWEEKAIYEAAKKKGLDLKKIDCKDLVIDLNTSDSEFSNQIIIQRCVSYFKSLHSTAALEGLGAKVINPLNTAINCGNKLFTHMLMKKNGIQTPKVLTAFSSESALSALNDFGYPVIIKPTIGSWGRLIALLRDKEAARAVFEDREHMFPLYQIYYLEEFVSRPPRDIRAIVVGDSVVAAIYRYSEKDEWKTNMALGGRAENCPITNELEDICIKSSQALGGKIVGVDLMESSKDGLLVHEVNNTTEFKNTVRITGVNIQDIIVDYSLKYKND
ncbi:MAG TPA: lysine biosynthesis protein LysX [Nitrososphaeraceae archaeon]|nr:lysine biosynthesis protein LysX [Nitrososphaeraceae archaeon]